VGEGSHHRFHLKNPLEGYRRLTFMMLDAEVVAVSPASVWRVLRQAGLLSRWKGKPSRKGMGFEQPLQPHQHCGDATMLRDNLAGLIEPMLSSAAAHNLAAVRTAQHKSHRTIDPQCHKNPRPEGAESTLTGNAASPFPAEPSSAKRTVTLVWWPFMER
jgi:hypothetical protein